MLVEFAMILPVAMLLFMVLIETSRALLIQHSIDTAAYEGARVGIIAGASAAEVVAESQSLLDAAGLVDTAIEVEPTTITEDTAVIRVRITVPAQSNQWFIIPDAVDFDIVSEVALMTERPPIVKLSGLPKLLQQLSIPQRN
ncbi:MAG: TadE family protein [Planctomycetota bacterium]